MTLRLWLILILILSVSSANGQKTPEDYMEEAREVQCFRGKLIDERQKAHDSIALADYMYIVKEHPTCTLCLTAYYNIARIYEREHRETDAIATYRTVVTIAMRSNSPRGGYSYRNEGSEAARSLSDYYEKIGNYDSAIYFFGLCINHLPMFYGCGNEAEAGRESDILRYVKIYLEANRVSDAEHFLLSNMKYDPFESTEVVTNKLCEVFRKYERPRRLKAEINKAVSNYSLDTVFNTRDGNKDTTIFCNINFLGIKIRRYYKWQSSQNTISEIRGEHANLPEREQIIAFLKSSDLYNMIQRL